MLCILIQFLSNDHSTLWWMVVRVNGSRCVRSAEGQCFGSVVVHPLDFGAFFHSGK